MLTAAVVGCGPRGLEHAGALRAVRGIDLVAVVERLPEARAAAALGVRAYPRLAALAGNARPDIVVLATQPAGRPVLVEEAAALSGVRAIVVVDHAYDRFAEWALAATLHSRGRRLGYATGATVRHLYTRGFRELAPAMRDFTRGGSARTERVSWPSTATATSGTCRS